MITKVSKFRELINKELEKKINYGKIDFTNKFKELINTENGLVIKINDKTTIKFYKMFYNRKTKRDTVYGSIMYNETQVFNFNYSQNKYVKSTISDLNPVNRFFLKEICDFTDLKGKNEVKEVNGVKIKQNSNVSPYDFGVLNIKELNGLDIEEEVLRVLKKHIPFKFFKTDNTTYRKLLTNKEKKARLEGLAILGKETRRPRIANRLENIKGKAYQFRGELNYEYGGNY